MYLLAGPAADGRFTHTLLEPWQIGACPMSTSAATPAARGLAIAWETAGEVAWARVDDEARMTTGPVRPPQPGGHRKHPGVAMGPGGGLLFVWTEGMAWNRGGSLHWQAFDAAGRPTTVRGSVDGVPVWSRASVVADAGGYTIFY